MSRLADVTLALTRAAFAAEVDGDRDVARRINRALTALLTVEEEPDVPSAPGTRIGGFEVSHVR